mmetsp:Transcript_6240/g.38768  ORF Transcript_6240/g.38768 Transcript_6240/m.38768 type:complete len:666 (-) Transcript_6240:2464-4461(-)
MLGGIKDVENLLLGTAPPPEDPWGLTYVICFVLGVGTLLPWNVFITMKEFFYVRFRQAPYNLFLANNYEAIFAVGYQIFNFSAVFCFMAYQKRIPMWLQIPMPIFVCLVIFAIMLFTVPVTWMGGAAMATLTVTCVCVTGAMGAVLGAGVFGLAALFPPAYTQAVFAGQGCAGFLVSLTALLTVWSNSSTEKHATVKELIPSTLRYFFVVVLFEFLALIGYLVLRALPFANYFAADGWRNGHRSHPNRWKWEGLSGDALEGAELGTPLLYSMNEAVLAASRDRRSALTSALKAEQGEEMNLSIQDSGQHSASFLKTVDDPQASFSVPIGSFNNSASPVPAGSSPPVYSRSPSGKWRRVDSQTQMQSIHRPGHFGLYGASPGMTGLSPVMGAHNWTPVVTSMEIPGRRSSPTMAAGAPFAMQTRQLQGTTLTHSVQQQSSNSALPSTLEGEEEQTGSLSRIPSQTAVESILVEGTFQGLNKRMWAYGYHVMFTFLVTLTLFPTFTSSICSVENPAVHPPCVARVSGGRLLGDLWTPLGFVLYNGGDMFGRILCGYGPWAHKPPQPKSLIALSTLRLLFVPLILGCNVVRNGGWHFPYLFRHDIYPVSFISLLGMTNGYLAGVALMHAPLFVHAPQRESAGAFMQFCLICGLTIGSAIALGVNQVLP